VILHERHENFRLTVPFTVTVEPSMPLAFLYQIDVRSSEASEVLFRTSGDHPEGVL